MPTIAMAMVIFSIAHTFMAVVAFPVKNAGLHAQNDGPVDPTEFVTAVYPYHALLQPGPNLFQFSKTGLRLRNHNSIQVYDQGIRPYYRLKNPLFISYNHINDQ